MAVVPGVLLDQVEQDPAQAGGTTVGPGAPGQPLQAASASTSATRERELVLGDHVLVGKRQEARGVERAKGIEPSPRAWEAPSDRSGQADPAAPWACPSTVIVRG